MCVLRYEPLDVADLVTVPVHGRLVVDRVIWYPKRGGVGPSMSWYAVAHARPIDTDVRIRPPDA